MNDHGKAAEKKALIYLKVVRVLQKKPSWKPVLMWPSLTLCFHKFKSQLHWETFVSADTFRQHGTEWERETGSHNQFLETDLFFSMHSLTTKIHHAVSYLRHQHKLFNRL